MLLGAVESRGALVLGMRVVMVTMGRGNWSGGCEELGVQELVEGRRGRVRSRVNSSLVHGRHFMARD
jgi:hypothetical protein